MTDSEIDYACDKMDALVSIGIPFNKICPVGFDNTLFVIKTDDENVEECTYLVLTDDEANDKVIDIIETEPHRLTVDTLFHYLPENSLTLDQLEAVKNDLSEVLFDEIFCRMLELYERMEEYVQEIYDTHTYDFFLSSDNKEFMVNGFRIYKV